MFIDMHSPEGTGSGSESPKNITSTGLGAKLQLVVDTSKRRELVAEAELEKVITRPETPRANKYKKKAEAVYCALESAFVPIEKSERIEAEMKKLPEAEQLSNPAITKALEFATSALSGATALMFATPALSGTPMDGVDSTVTPVTVPSETPVLYCGTPMEGIDTNPYPS